MIVEGVTFVEHAIKQMKKKDFIEAHIAVLWKERTPEEREKMLSDVYDTIQGKEKTK